jgi:hypothetical protein
MTAYMSSEVVADRRLQTHPSNHDLLKTFIGFFATMMPILGVVGEAFEIAPSVLNPVSASP